MWKRALVLALALTFAAGPAFARGGGKWKNHDRRGHHAERADRHHGYHYRQHRSYRPYRHRGHHGHHVDAGDAFLWLGLTAIGITAVNAWSQNAYYARQAPRYVEPYPAQTAYDARRVVFDERTVTPVGDVYRDDGEYCREYQTEIEIGGRLERAYGTACLQPDGTWATR